MDYLLHSLRSSASIAGNIRPISHCRPPVRGWWLVVNELKPLPGSLMQEVDDDDGDLP